ncbi:hypothetical protein BU17DRAFT_70631 [Hysterangium stoloniferum]|nr:hypothetical protein BU17DRAFT_70631 [Hysterangium stoloniferum]
MTSTVSQIEIIPKSSKLWDIGIQGSLMTDIRGFLYIEQRIRGTISCDGLSGVQADAVMPGVQAAQRNERGCDTESQNARMHGVMAGYELVILGVNPGHQCIAHRWSMVSLHPPATPTVRPISRKKRGQQEHDEQAREQGPPKSHKTTGRGRTPRKGSESWRPYDSWCQVMWKIVGMVYNTVGSLVSSMPSMVHRPLAIMIGALLLHLTIPRHEITYPAPLNNGPYASLTAGFLAPPAGGGHLPLGHVLYGTHNRPPDIMDTAAVTVLYRCMTNVGLSTPPDSVPKRHEQITQGTDNHSRGNSVQIVYMTSGDFAVSTRFFVRRVLRQRRARWSSIALGALEKESAAAAQETDTCHSGQVEARYAFRHSLDYHPCFVKYIRCRLRRKITVISPLKLWRWVVKSLTWGLGMESHHDIALDCPTRAPSMGRFKVIQPGRPSDALGDAWLALVRGNIANADRQNGQKPELGDDIMPINPVKALGAQCKGKEV